MDEWNILSLCLWREARGEPYRGKVAVAWSIINRTEHPNWWGNSVHTVILKPFQYSSFNKNDPNVILFPMPNDLSWIECKGIASEVICKIVADPTSGSTHYHASSLVGDKLPEWAKTAQFKVQLGNHLFYVAN